MYTERLKQIPFACVSCFIMKKLVYVYKCLGFLMVSITGFDKVNVFFCVTKDPNGKRKNVTAQDV